MNPVSTRLDDETYRIVRELVAESDGGLADVLRGLIDSGLAHESRETERIDNDTARIARDTAGVDGDTELDEAIRALCERADRVDELERENERLHRERRQLLEQREENTELVRYAQEARSIERRRAEREEHRQAVTIFRRAWWAIAGDPHARRAVRNGDRSEQRPERG